MLLLAIWLLCLNASYSNSIHKIPIAGATRTDIDDPSFYSRQLFVYGKSAQAKLKDSKVLLVSSSDRFCESCRLLVEVGKNLALAGVGHLFLHGNHFKSETISLASGDSSLVNYVMELNPNIKVYNVSVKPSSILNNFSSFRPLRLRS